MLDTFPRAGQRECPDLPATHQLGEELGRALETGDVVILDGPLGAGKTTFTQGIARGMQVKGRVTSPTFIIAREHRSTVGGPALIHMDAYRLLDSGTDPLGELDALDLDTELDQAVVVAEWGAGLAEQLEQDYLLVRIDREAGSCADARVFAWSFNHRN
ncbi:ATP-binding protein [Corynebacterium phocae]|uniref:tRNA threonylcarbamoyladenosine biosynthesis protein TsaE n=1 Tax=Corynebacterium phocae TaxID=161895 RepID=A0A1L7D5B7_9CORY|nr:tRNA (adenosine(37)-N6)-threonylcarbamoyltransferase complex ATPase subunit type 1 TsaE [Corynebacterium phocae]APT93193.1 ATP-binding protein [Corynebacterium phocae]KAA8721930.1 tRNA (adenosine(37)-N6)-threonylcarbamoyltransferase complex ATPase subunit type 1 TsaE [Corynebacterium phocae]